MRTHIPEDMSTDQWLHEVKQGPVLTDASASSQQAFVRRQDEQREHYVLVLAIFGPLVVEDLPAWRGLHV